VVLAAGLFGGALAVVACVGDDPATVSVVDPDAGNDASNADVIVGTIDDSGSDASGDAAAPPPNPTGNLVWASILTNPSSPSFAIVNDVAIDDAGNVAIVGSYASYSPVEFGNGKAVPASPAGAGYVAKYDPTGTCLWAVAINAPGGGIYPPVTGVGIDPTNGDVVFVASVPAAVAIGNGTPKGGFGPMDIAVGKLSSAGVEKYLKVFGGPDSDNVDDVAIDASGRVVITGDITNSTGNPILFDSVEASASQTGGPQAYVASLDTAGVTQWVRTFPRTGATGSSTGHAVSIDADRNVTMGGEFSGVLLWNYPSGGPYNNKTLTASGPSNGFVVKLDGVTGAQGWASAIGSGATASVVSVGTDPARKVFTAFTYTGAFALGSRTLTAFGQQDIGFARFDPGGTVLDAHEFGTANPETAAALAIDRWGETIFGGTEGATIDFGLPATSHGQADGFIAKYDDKLKAVWAQGMGGTGADGVYRIAVNASGRIAFVGGFSTNGTIGTKTLTTDAGTGGRVVGVLEP
jgi:hypothetical protein